MFLNPQNNICNILSPLKNPNLQTRYDVTMLVCARLKLRFNVITEKLPLVSNLANTSF